MCKENEICAVKDLIDRSFGSRSAHERQQIVSNGRPMPSMTGLVQKTKTCTRYFKVTLYAENQWLTACEKQNELYCWWCLLFAPRGVTPGPFLAYGVKDLNNFANKKRHHCAQEDHLNAARAIVNFGKNTDVNLQVNEHERLNVKAHNARVTENRQLLRVLIDVVVFLGKQKLAFRGHNESRNLITAVITWNVLNF